MVLSTKCCLISFRLGPVVCPAGTLSLLGTAVCSPCPAGYRCPGASQQVACTAGTYSLAGSSAGCVTCPAGSSCASPSAGPTECTAGSYSSAGGTACIATDTTYCLLCLSVCLSVCLSLALQPNRCVRISLCSQRDVLVRPLPANRCLSAVLLLVGWYLICC